MWLPWARCSSPETLGGPYLSLSTFTRGSCQSSPLGGRGARAFGVVVCVPRCMFGLPVTVWTGNVWDVGPLQCCIVTVCPQAPANLPCGTWAGPRFCFHCWTLSAHLTPMECCKSLMPGMGVMMACPTAIPVGVATWLRLYPDGWDLVRWHPSQVWGRRPRIGGPLSECDGGNGGFWLARSCRRDGRSAAG